MLGAVLQHAVCDGFNSHKDLHIHLQKRIECSKQEHTCSEIFFATNRGVIMNNELQCVCIHIRCNIAAFILRDWRNP